MILYPPLNLFPPRHTPPKADSAWSPVALNLPWVSSGVTASRRVSPSPFLPLRRDVFSLSSLVGSVHWHWPRRCHCSEVRNVTLLLSKRIWCCSTAAVGFHLLWFALHFSLCSSSLESRFLTDMMSMQHRKLCSILFNNLNGKIIWKRIDTCIRRSKSLCCTPENNITLLINYNTILIKILGNRKSFLELCHF